ncbi:Na+/H+ antiporter NhaA [uncultured Amnibacterium sp.]|uniref:Na+/H+ antiporter NhaA n=1 Tax=uncultured Amnibacterium sp. TaxID=1631851 RepID=UPI0035CA47AF
MRFITSDRGSATLLLAAAALALVLAATPLGPALIGARDLPLALDATGLRLTPGLVVSDGLLAIFFLLVAIELRHELTGGDLAHPASAAVPALAALGGVAAPAGIYLAVAGPASAGGWPIPTATDIAFALGLLALVGRGLPSRVRAFLLALAILDDLVAILLIAVVFPHGMQPVLVVAALVPLAAFGVVARLGGPSTARTAALWVLGLAVWYLVARSGVHSTLAGVALGLALPSGPGATADRLLQPVSRAVVLPLFAFSASLIRVEDVVLGPVFVAVVLALPVGKLVGITAGGLLGHAVLGRRSPNPLRPAELVAVGLVGGVGFTVSLLMAQLAFAEAGTRSSATLGVLVGSLAAIVLSVAVVPPIARRSRSHP